MSKQHECHEFERGYFCAVASLLYLEGGNSVRVSELFRDGGGIGIASKYADAVDLGKFQKAGMMQP